MNANVLQDNLYIFFHTEFPAPVNVNVLDAKMASMKIYLKLKIQVKMIAAAVMKGKYQITVKLIFSYQMKRNLWTFDNINESE